ncbi:hypothetical protein [Micromonospora arborensis]|uniref:hypothetical protein n=1 Tax=Micromonospora arborensis TaxID=2116518 RepID=UPI0037187428
MSSIPWTDRAQALSSLLALAVAMPALIVAAVTYRDQQEINRAQLESTRLERQRYEQRYASRMALWRTEDPAETGPNTPVTVRVQNRSPVPMTRLNVGLLDLGRAQNDPERETSYMSWIDVPPCSLVTLRLTNHAGVLITASSVWVSMSFSDAVDDWYLGNDGLVAGPDIWIPGGFAVEAKEQRAAAEDCGEGG